MVPQVGVWRLTQRWGEAIQALEAKESERANHTYDPLAAGPDGQATTKRRGVAMDGTMIFVRQEGWKELKVGCFFDVELAPWRDPETGERIELGRARNNSYVSHLGGPEAFGEKM